MPMYLIGETSDPNTIVAAPTIVAEIEVEALDLRAAAEAVMGRAKGRLPKGMTFRSPTHDHYSLGISRYIEPDPSKYAGIADIVAGKPETLPSAFSYVPRKESLDAAKAALDVHTKALKLDCEGNTGTAVYHLIYSLIDHADSVGGNFGEILKEVLNDRSDITGGTAPHVNGTVFGADSGNVSPDVVAAAQQALDIASETDHTEDSEDADVALYHLLHSLIDLCETEKVNFGKVVDQVRSDRPEPSTDSAPLP